MEYICKVCDRSLPHEKFRNIRKSGKGKGGTCRDCHNKFRRENPLYKQQKAEHRRALREQDFTGEYAQKLKSQRLLTRFNISQEQYVKLISKFPTSCQLCSREYSAKGPVFDHDHSCCPGRKSCGKCIRGVICNRCNLSLGAISDNADTLKNMIKYLEKYHEIRDM